MYEMMGCLDRLLENDDTPAKRQERDIVAVLIILINLLAAVMIPLCRAIVFISTSKVSFSTFALTSVKWLWNMCSFCGQAKEGKPKAEWQAKLTKVSSLLDDSRQVNVLFSVLPTSPPSLRSPLPHTYSDIA
jgi:hypothetical protein